MSQPPRYLLEPTPEERALGLAAGSLTMLVCPACHGDLAPAEAALTCPRCALRYPVEDGIPVLLASRAVSL
ncbi:MAG: Trm112 family protein [Candidatus Dormibacteria bacterium]